LAFFFDVMNCTISLKDHGCQNSARQSLVDHLTAGNIFDRIFSPEHEFWEFVSDRSGVSIGTATPAQQNHTSHPIMKNEFLKLTFVGEKSAKGSRKMIRGRFAKGWR
jgi:hypothetical protein